MLPEKITKTSAILSPEQELAAAMKEPAIRSLTDKQVEAALSVIIWHCFKVCGFKIEKEAVDFQAKEMLKDLRQYFPGFTPGEVRIALSMGARGEFGEVRLNVSNYFQWLQKFRGLDQRKQAAIAVHKPAQPEAVLSPEELEAALIQGALRKFEDFKTHGHCLDLGSTTYNFLDKKQIINFSNQRKKELYREAQLELMRDRQSKVRMADFFSRKEIMREIEEIQAGSADATISLAKKKALELYFKDLIDFGTELKDLLHSPNPIIERT